MGKLGKAIGIASTAICLGALGFVGVSAGLAHNNGRTLPEEWQSWGEHKVVDDETPSDDETPTDEGTGEDAGTTEDGTQTEEGGETEETETLSIRSNGQTVNLRYSL